MSKGHPKHKMLSGFDLLRVADLKHKKPSGFDY
jgi:hypothetical protein